MLAWLAERMGAWRNRGTRARAQDLLGFEDIQDGVVRLGGGRCRVGLEVGSVNYQLMGEKEQEAVEEAFMRVLATIRWPVQVFVQTRLLDLEDEIGRLDRQAAELEGALREYALTMADYLRAIQREAAILVRRHFLVFPHEGRDEEEVVAELRRRQSVVREALERVGIGARPLTTEDWVEILYIYACKERSLAARVTDAAGRGFLKLTVRGRTRAGEYLADGVPSVRIQASGRGEGV